MGSLTHRRSSDRLHEVYRSDLHKVASRASAEAKILHDERDLATQAVMAKEKQLDALTKETAKLRLDLMDVTKKFENTRVLNERLVQARDVALGEKNTLYERVAAMNQDNENLVQTIRNLMQTAQELRDSQGDSEATAQTIKDLKAANTELASRVREQNREVNKMTAELTKLKTALIDTTKRYETSDIELTRLQGLLAAAKIAQLAEVDRLRSEYEEKIKAAESGSAKDGDAAKVKWEQEKEAAAAELAQVKEQLQTALDTIAVEKESTEELLEELNQNFTQREAAVQSEKDVLLAQVRRQEEEAKAKDQAVADQAAKVFALEKVSSMVLTLRLTS